MVPVRIIMFLRLLFPHGINAASCVEPAQEAAVAGLLFFYCLGRKLLCSLTLNKCPWLTHLRSLTHLKSEVWRGFTWLGNLPPQLYSLCDVQASNVLLKGLSAEALKQTCPKLLTPGGRSTMEDSSRKHKTMILFVVLLHVFLTKRHWEKGLELTSLNLVLVEMERFYGWVFSVVENLVWWLITGTIKSKYGSGVVTDSTWLFSWCLCMVSFMYF